MGKEKLRKFLFIALFVLAAALFYYFIVIEWEEQINQIVEDMGILAPLGIFILRGISTIFPVISNLPYNISTKILSNWCLNKKIKFERLVLMFQKEVADRIVANVNTKDYSRITILANWKFKIQKKFDVSADNFYPVPKIQSSVLDFLPKERIADIKNPKNLEYITQVLFNQRRKMIKNNIKKLFFNFEEILKNNNISPRDRPQNINIDKFLDIVIAYEKNLS